MWLCCVLRAILRRLTATLLLSREEAAAEVVLARDEVIELLVFVLLR